MSSAPSLFGLSPPQTRASPAFPEKKLVCNPWNWVRMSFSKNPFSQLESTAISESVAQDDVHALGDLLSRLLPLIEEKISIAKSDLSSKTTLERSLLSDHCRDLTPCLLQVVGIIDTLFYSYQKRVEKIVALLPHAHNLYRVKELCYNLHQKLSKRQTSHVTTATVSYTSFLQNASGIVEKMSNLLGQKQYRVIKPQTSKIPFSIALIKNGGQYVHTKIRIDGESEPTYKKVKRAYSLSLKKEVAKLTTTMDPRNTEFYQHAKNEESFLERVNMGKIPHAIQTHDIVWEEKTTKRGQRVRRQIIYQELGVRGTLHAAKARLVENPEKIKQVLKKVLCCVAEYHAEKIVISDIKGENIVLDDQDNPKIIDLGFTHEEGTIRNSVCCTPSYADPRILTYPHIMICAQDIWSLGILWYLYLYNTPTTPWGVLAENYSQLTEHTQTKKVYQFPEPPPERVYEHLTWRMLQDDPSARPTAQQCLCILDAAEK